MKKHLVALLCILPLVLFFMLVLVYPFADMMYQGAMPKLEILDAGGAADVAARSRGWSELTLKNYTAVFTDRFLRETMFLSLGLSALVSVLSIALCIGPAWLLVRKDFPGKRAFRAILTLSLIHI